ncbi:hypothetical protein, partial [Planococcus notacanthi]
DSIDFREKNEQTDFTKKKDTFKTLILLGSSFLGGALFSFGRNALSSSLHTFFLEINLFSNQQKGAVNYVDALHLDFPAVCWRHIFH